MQAGDQGRGITAAEELGDLDDDGDEEDEIVLEANNAQQSNRPQGDWAGGGPLLGNSKII